MSVFNRAKLRAAEKELEHSKEVINTLTKRNLELIEQIQKLTSNDTFRAIDIDRKEELCRCDNPMLRVNKSSDHGYTHICLNCGGWK